MWTFLLTTDMNKNSADVYVTPALSKVTGAQNLGQGHRVIKQA